MEDTEKAESEKILKERFLALPKVVQNAIVSADVERSLRQLSDTNRLHLDQWEALEHEVMMTLYGITAIDELETNIKEQVGVTDDIARELTTGISQIVFEPIRAELEKELETSAPKAEAPGVAAADSRTFSQAFTPAAPVAPATPPPPPPEKSAVRAPISASYAAAQPSHERKIVEGDPYREQVV